MLKVWWWGGEILGQNPTLLYKSLCWLANLQSFIIYVRNAVLYLARGYMSYCVMGNCMDGRRPSFCSQGRKIPPLTQAKMPLLELEKLVTGRVDLVFQRSTEGLLGRMIDPPVPEIQSQGHLLKIE